MEVEVTDTAPGSTPVVDARGAACCRCLFSNCRLAAAAVLHGVGCGLISIFVSVLIRNVQIIGFGQAQGSFLDISEAAPAWRRMTSVTFAGIFGAVCWLTLRGREPSFVPVKDSIVKGQKMPIVVTWLNAMLQDIVVALGGSVGREAAPREMAAMYAGHLADSMGIEPEHRSVLVACGTGAGLAGVYSVPISGVVYTLEHTLHWKDRSLKTLAVAIVTSFLATYVGQWVVEACCLYPTEKYSAEWPSLAILLWSVLIGPVCGVAAYLFGQLISFAMAQRPLGRMPMKFQKALEGHHVRLLDKPKDGVRRKAKIISKDGQPFPNHPAEYRTEANRPRAGSDDVDGYIRVKFTDDGHEEELNCHEWNAREPLGWRDWSILVVMPTAFLVLALLCVRFPALMGNGRALAQVAMDDTRVTPLWELMCLFVLKALVTAAALGAGADGGTLTPSVALGAALGAMVAKLWEVVSPGSIALKQAALVTSTAFLGSAMNAPASGLCLLVEFAGQGIDQDGLVSALHGDFKPLVESKLAIGMLLPMVVATYGAQKVCRYLHALHDAPKPRPRFNSDFASPSKSQAIIRFAAVRDWGKSMRGAVQADDNDLDLDNDFGHFTIDSESQTWCLKSFHICLQANTCITVGVATTFFSRLWSKGHLVTMMSFVVVVLSAIVCLMARLLLMVRKPGRHLTQPQPQFQRNASGDNLVSLLGKEKENADYTPLFACKGLRQRLYSASLAALSGALGASMPMVPWALAIWKNHQEFASIAASIATATLAIALVSTTELRRDIGGIYVVEAEEVRIKKVLRRSGEVVVVAAISAAIGGVTWLIDVV
jgi:H+/Cl- antiporter ClcA